MKRGAETRMGVRIRERAREKDECTARRRSVRFGRRHGVASARARDCDVDSGRFGFSHFYTFYAFERSTRRLLAPETPLSRRERRYTMTRVAVRDLSRRYDVGMGSTSTPSSGLNALAPS